MKTSNKCILMRARIALLLAAGALMTISPVTRGDDYYWIGASNGWNIPASWQLNGPGGATPARVPGAADNIVGNGNGNYLNLEVGRAINNATSTYAGTWQWIMGSGTFTVGGTLTLNAGAHITVRSGAGTLDINKLVVNNANFNTNNNTTFYIGGLKINELDFTQGTISIAISGSHSTDINNPVISTREYQLGKINLMGTASKSIYLANYGHQNNTTDFLILKNTAITTGISDASGASGAIIYGSSATPVAMPADTKHEPVLELRIADGDSYTTAARLRDSSVTPAKGILTVKKTGAGTQVLSGVNSDYTGGTELVSGTLGVGHASALGTGTVSVSSSATLPALALYANNITLAVPLAINGDALLDSGAFTGTLSGALSGTAAIIKTGAGTLALTGNTANYTGGAVIQAGVLKLAGAGSLDGVRAVTIAPGATLEGNLARAASGHSLAGSGTLAGNLTLAGGSLLFDISEPDLAPLSITGTLTSTAGDTIGLGALASGTFNLVKSGTIIGSTSDYTVLSNGAPITARNDYRLTVSATDMVLVNKVVSLDLTWTGSDGASAAWAASSTSAANWTDGGNIAETRFSTGDNVTFDGTDTTGNRIIAVAASGVVASELNVKGDGAYAFTGGTITTSSASVLAGSSLSGTSGQLIKAGTGTLVFQNSANDFSAGIKIAGGVIAFNSAPQLGDGGNGIQFSGDASLRADADGLSLANTIIIDNGMTATLDTQGNTLSYSGTLSLSGASGTFAKAGAGLLVLTTDNTAYTGVTVVNAGSLILDNGGWLGGDVHVNTADAAFGGRGGNLNNNVTVSDGGIFQVGGGVASGTLTVGGTLSLTDASIAFNLYDNEKSDTLLFGTSGTVVLSGSNTVDFHPTVTTSGTFFISTDKNLAGAHITIDRQTIDFTSRQEVRWDTSGANLNLVYGLDTSRIMTWTGGAGDGKWNSDGSANWTGSEGKTKFLHGDAVLFNAASGAFNIEAAAARVSSIEININDADTLTLDGYGIQADGAFVTGTEVPEASRATGMLVKHGAGALVFQNAANTFAGGIDISGGLIGFNNGDQLQTGTAAIHFTGDATLRADDEVTLAGPMIIDGGKSAVFDTQGYFMTLTGTLSGTGTAVKKGAGLLTYSGTASLGHAATRVDEGMIKLDGISGADAPAIAHAFALNGGWVDLSDTPYDSTGTTVNDWAGLVFTGSSGSGGVIGSNDKITLRAGDVRFGIGHETDGVKQGVFVVVDAGADGVATLTGPGNYVGYTMLKSGTLRISDNNQLGMVDGFNREVVFDGPGGAVLEITANHFATTRAIDLRAAGGVSVADGITAVWGGGLSGDGSFTKAGAGTLVLTANASHTGSTIVQGGALEGHVGSLRGDIAINAGAALAFSQTGTGVFNGRITGAGETMIKSGEIQAAAANVFSADSIHNIAAGATLNFAGFNQTIAGMRNNGIVNVGVGKASSDVGARLAINGDYHGTPGSQLNLNWKVDNGILLTDTVEITGQSSGETRLNFINSDSNALNNRIEDPVDFSSARFLVAEPGAADVFYGEYFINYIWYELGLDAGGNLTFVAKDSMPVDAAALGVDLAALFTGKAAYETLGRRLSTMRRIETQPSHKWDFWIDGIYRHDRMNSTVYDGVKINTQGMQVGADYAEGDKNAFLIFGVFADYVRGDLDVGASARTESEVYGYGVYSTYRLKSWYLDIMVRASTDSYRADSYFAPEFDMSGRSFGGSVGTGGIFETASGWRIEPQVQASYQLYRGDSSKDAAGHNYSMEDVESITGRAGVLVARPMAIGSASRFLPYVRLGVEQEIGADNKFTASRTVVSDDLSGTMGIADAGVALRLGSHFCASADASLYYGNKYDGYSVNFGLRFNW